MSEREPELTADEYAGTIAENRREKDEFFGDHPQSPIPPESREVRRPRLLRARHRVSR